MTNKLVFLLFAVGTLSVAAGQKRYRCGYVYRNDVNGFFKLHIVPADWHEARLRCHLEGSVLASPLNKEFHNAIIDIMDKNQTGYIHTGVSAIFSKGDYQSVEGVPLRQLYVNWNTDEPNNLNGEESCLVLDKSGKMNDQDCKKVFPYICYKSNFPPVLDQGAVTRKDNICDEYIYPGYENWSVDYGTCYKFHTTIRDWSRAYMACAAEDGHLAIINSKAEADYITKLYAKHAYQIIGPSADHKDYAFIGFHDWGEHGEWLTVQGQTLKAAGYEKFALGEPNNSTNSQHPEFCGAWNRYGGLNDLDCHKPFAFICERRTYEC